MGLIVDVVPNHMGVGDLTNRWWIDVLENGQASRFANFFDIDWHPANPSLHAKVLLPILGGFYGTVLERGEIRLSFDQGRFWLNYYDYRLPVSPHSIGSLLEICAEELGQTHVESDEVQELRSIATACRHITPRSDLAPEELAERYREKEVVRRRLARLSESSTRVRGALERTVAKYNGNPGDTRSFDLLDALINAQPYRPAFWRIAAEEINYRRFFDINELAAIRMELPEVFHETHAFILQLLNDDKVTGLRIDHPDGLRDPAGYLRELQRVSFLNQLRRRLPVPLGEDLLQTQFHRLWHRAAFDSDARPQWPLFIVVEKILSEEEPLPREWPVAGTTGYDFLISVNGLFVDRSHESAWDRIYREWSGHRSEFRDVVLVSKRKVMQLSMTSEINSLAYRLDRITERNRRYRDFTLNTLRLAIRETIAALAVYRTYVTDADHIPDRDKQVIESAVAEARRLNPGVAAEVFQFLRDFLLLRNLREFDEPDRDAVLNWVLRFQQLTGPIMAKGVEDTSFYIYNRFVGLNEVGGNPDRFGVSLETFHAQTMERLRHWPHAMLSTSTHDTKRSEDVRARLAALSEMPNEWESALARWREWNAGHLTKVDRYLAPSANDQYLIYQTLIGAWPNEALAGEERLRFRQRIVDYALKAAKEAKTHTSWTNQNADYEEALRRFVEQIVPESGETPFLRDIQAFQQRVAHFGSLNSLAQITLKLTCPGVPDIYQGCELWDLSLVDPDNRRPVDFQMRRKMLVELRDQIASHGDDLAGFLAQMLANRADGRIKLYVIHRLLTLRREKPHVFDVGDYRPLPIEEFDPETICAFARQASNDVLIVAAPCRIVRLLRGWEGLPNAETWQSGFISIPEGLLANPFRNVLTGNTLELDSGAGPARLPLATVFQDFPVAVLIGSTAPPRPDSNGPDAAIVPK